MDRRIALPLLVVMSACIHVYQTVKARPLDARKPVAVITPVKAHLLDGSTVVFRHGITVDGDTVRAHGYRYGVTLHDSVMIVRVPLDSVIGMEVFEQSTNGVSSFLISVLATAGTAVVVGAAAVAIFGSCPTFYADSAGTPMLQAEGFSYSIAPMFESRDVDRLRIHQAADGSLRLEVRNEALETHYLNQLQLLEVSHGADETAFVDEMNRLVVVGDEVAPLRAIDRFGRDMTEALREHDGVVYQADARAMSHAQPGDLDDWIELTAAAPPGADSVAIVLRLRNSLLNTVLLYDIMLGDPGARSLDWVGQDLKQVGPAIAVAQWYQERMGMEVSVAGRDGYRVITHVKDTGPIAWKDVAVVVPVLTQDSIRVRLKFPIDNWRIDRIAFAGRLRRVPASAVPLVAVEEGPPLFLDTTALASLSAADSRYLQTVPGQHFTAVFRPNPMRVAEARTFFLASQGYYIEWLRRHWLRSPRADRTFTPSDTALGEALSRWRVSQDSLETLFMASRIPVR